MKTIQANYFLTYLWYQKPPLPAGAKYPEISTSTCTLPDENTLNFPSRATALYTEPAIKRPVWKFKLDTALRSLLAGQMVRNPPTGPKKKQITAQVNWEYNGVDEFSGEKHMHARTHARTQAHTHSSTHALKHTHAQNQSENKQIEFASLPS